MKAIQQLNHFGVDIVGIVHVGASNGTESDVYKGTKARICVYIEPIPEVFAKLKKNTDRFPGHFAVQALCSDRDGETVTFNVSSNGGQSSSMLPLGDHAVLFPDITYVSSSEFVTCTLDSLLADNFPDASFNLLVIDVQGAELKVLQGATKLLETLDAVFLEVSDSPLYQGNCTFDELVEFFRPLGFRQKWMAISKHGFGDAFFLRQPTLAEPVGENVALHRPASQSSLSQWSKADGAQGGNNGKKTGKFGFHTNMEQTPWWQVDLQQVKDIQEIRVYNRLDMLPERAAKLQVLLSNDGEHWRLLHDQNGRRFGGIDHRALQIQGHGAPARFVKLQLPGKQVLHLDEVEVFA